VTLSGAAPFFNEDRSDLCQSKNAHTTEGACRDEIDWMINPNPVEAPEVTMHASL
jgi:hypothetical protein